MSTAAVNVACIFPGVQQVIGIGTMASNAIKCIADKIELLKIEKKLNRYSVQRSHFDPNKEPHIYKSHNVVCTDIDNEKKK